MQTLSQARRIALAAQGFKDPRHTAPTMRTFNRTLARTGVLQVDSVNVLQRAHYMPLFSRMGPYDTELLHRAAEKAPAADRRVLGARPGVHAGGPLAGHAAPDGGVPRPSRASGGAACRTRSIQVLLAEIADRGASTARELEHTIDAGPRRKDHWGWNWSEARKGLDFLYMVGDVAIAGRTSQFEVRYDLPERVIPAEVLARPTPCLEEAERELVRRAAASHGVATLKCLADYYRTTQAPVKTAVDAAGRGGRAGPGPGRGLEQAGLPAPGRRAAAQGRGPGAAQPVRPGGLGAGAHRAALRLPLPDRDLHAGREAGARLLRPAVPAARRDRRAGGPQGRPAQRHAAGAVGLGRGRRARGHRAPSSRAELDVLAGWLGPRLGQDRAEGRPGAAAARWPSAEERSAPTRPLRSRTALCPCRYVAPRPSDIYPGVLLPCLPSSTSSSASARARSSASSRRSPQRSTRSRTTSSR